MVPLNKPHKDTAERPAVVLFPPVGQSYTVYSTFIWCINNHKKDSVSCHGSVFPLGPCGQPIRRCVAVLSQAFKGFRVQFEMKKKQIEGLLQPVHREGRLSSDQALVKQACERLSARVRTSWRLACRFSVHAVPFGLRLSPCGF